LFNNSIFKKLKNKCHLTKNVKMGKKDKN